MVFYNLCFFGRGYGFGGSKTLGKGDSVGLRFCLAWGYSGVCVLALGSKEVGGWFGLGKEGWCLDNYMGNFESEMGISPCFSTLCSGISNC